MKTFCVYMPRALSKDGDCACFAKLVDELLGGISNVLTPLDAFSLEIYCKKQIIYFVFVADDSVSNAIKGSLYTVFPTIDIKEINDPLLDISPENYEISISKLKLKRKEVFSLSDYSSFSYNTISTVIHPFLSYLQEDFSVIQIVCNPFHPSSFYLRTLDAKVRRDKAKRMLTTLKYWSGDKSDEEYAKNANSKIKGCNCFRVTIRLASFYKKNLAPQNILLEKLQSNLESISGAFSRFDSPFNSFVCSEVSNSENEFYRLVEREQDAGPYCLSSKELATFWGIPNLNEVKNIPTVLSVKSAPPSDLPINVKDPYISFFARTDYRDSNINFGIHREDRRRHLYIVGKSGAGKSSLMKLLAKYDIVNGAGFCVLDPHGDLVDDLLPLIPKNRVEDVVLFDVSDTEYPISFNPFSNVPSGYISQFVSSFIEVFQKTYIQIWNERLEHLLRYVILSLIQSPFANFADVRNLLTNKSFRINMMKGIKDSAVRDFWLHEYGDWYKNFYEESISPLLDKVDSFSENPYIKNIFSQSKNKLNFRDIIDNNKILLIKIPKGLLGDENASILGSMLVFKIHHAAMSRANIPEEARKDFYLYVDEFQSFMTASFKHILSEARKYRLNLTMAHQYLAQIPNEMTQTIFGNIANLIIFGMGAEDSEKISQELEPDFTKDDIMNLAPRHIYVKMSINNDAKKTFSAITLDVINSDAGFSKECIEYSRRTYAEKKNIVEENNKTKIGKYKTNEIESEAKVGTKIETNVLNKAKRKRNEVNEKEKISDCYLSQYLRCYGTVLLLSYLEIPNTICRELSQSLFKKIEEVDLKGAIFEDNAIGYISKLPLLAELILDGANISGKGLSYLANTKSLEILSLNNTKVSDNEVFMLLKTGIYVLNLKNTCITNKSMKIFYHMKNLVELDIRGTNVDECYVEKLRRLKPNLMIIK